MATDLPISTLVDFIIGDFEDTWDAVAARPGNLHRGNFLFGRQAMTLLEVVWPPLFNSDGTGHALKKFATELAVRDTRYFTKFPGSCWTPVNSPEFRLPSQGPNPESELIAALFDLIRNGQAHQYQQIRVQLADGKDFLFGLTGADDGLFLAQSLAAGRPTDHLLARKEPNGDIWVKVRTDVLFLDIREAARSANLLDGSLTLSFLTRPRSPNSPHYQFSSTDLESTLRAGGHFNTDVVKERGRSNRTVAAHGGDTLAE
jgi:hypothetical protein